MLGGGNRDAAADAVDLDRFVGREPGFCALTLAADLARGGVQTDAGFLIGFVGVGFIDLAVGEEADAGFDDVNVLSLDGEVDVLAGGEAAGVAAAEDDIGGRNRGNARGTAELQVGFAVGGDVALTAVVCVAVAITLRRLKNFEGVGLLLNGGEFVGCGFVLLLVVF